MSLFLQRIHKHLGTIVEAMMAKGLVKPDCVLSIRANREPSVDLTWQKKDIPHYEQGNYEFKHFRGEDLLVLVQDALAFVVAMPDKATRERDIFLTQLADTIEMGRKFGIDDEFVNPLSLLAQKLSENAIEHRPVE